MELHACTLSALRQKLEQGEVTSVEITRSVLERIAAVDGRIGAYLLVDEPAALAQAEAADSRRAGGENLSPAAGIPLGLKDLLSTAGMPTTCASRMLENYVPAYDATVVARLRQAAAVFAGKLNMDEFAMGSSNENSAFKLARNPWNLERVAGGSSGGSAAAVAADECIAALGSDTGGSIRQPAAFCGVVGLKPTYGRVSRYGLVAFASSLDQIGTLTKSVADAGLLLGEIAGHDSRDSTSVNLPVPDYLPAMEEEVKGLKIGIPREYFSADIHVEVRDAVRQAVEVFTGLGAEIEEVSLPHTEYAVAAYYLVATAVTTSCVQMSPAMVPAIFLSSLSSFFGLSRKMGESRKNITLGICSFLFWSMRSASVTIPTRFPASSTTGTPLMRCSESSLARSSTDVSG